MANSEAVLAAVRTFPGGLTVIDRPMSAIRIGRVRPNAGNATNVGVYRQRVLENGEWRDAVFVYSDYSRDWRRHR